MSSLTLNDMQNSWRKSTNKCPWKQRQISRWGGGGCMLPTRLSFCPVGGQEGPGLALELAAPSRVHRRPAHPGTVLVGLPAGLKAGEASGWARAWHIRAGGPSRSQPSHSQPPPRTLVRANHPRIVSVCSLAGPLIREFIMASKPTCTFFSFFFGKTGV